MISGTLWFWKMRQSEVRVSSHGQGRRVGIFRYQVQLVGEQPSQFLASLHALQQQHVRPQRAIHLDQAGQLHQSRLMSGNSVLVRIASIIRPPLSVSVQRETISSTTPSSNSNGTLWVASGDGFRLGHQFRIGAEAGDHLGAGVGGEQDQGVLEVDHPAFAVLHHALRP
ncbi:hypothetical protein RLJV_23905 [Pseudomonas aeruginosa]|nr:hypothetical protein RLJV_23905 [Pseudomonas aeruginosa]